MDLDFAKQTYHRGSMEPRKAACDETEQQRSASRGSNLQLIGHTVTESKKRKQLQMPVRTTGDPVPQFTAETSRHTLDLAG